MSLALRLFVGFLIFLIVNVHIIVVVVKAETVQGFKNVLPLDCVSASVQGFVSGFTGDKKDELSDELLDCFHAFLGDFRHLSIGLLVQFVVFIIHAVGCMLIVCNTTK